VASPTSLPDRKATEFLTDLAEKPFIALVLSDSEVRVFSKGLDEATMKKVEGLIEQITSGSA
jgi:hypothetical protein